MMAVAVEPRAVGAAEPEEGAAPTAAGVAAAEGKVAEEEPAEGEPAAVLERLHLSFLQGACGNGSHERCSAP